MSSIEKRGSRYVMRYRDPVGVQRSKAFGRKADAEKFRTTIESSKLTGTYIQPTLAKLTVRPWSETWLSDQVHLKPSTRERYAGILRTHIWPRWGEVRLADVGHADVQAWIRKLSSSLASGSVRKAHRVLSLILAAAVKDGRLVRNVASGVSLPRVVTTERRFLTHEQVAELAESCGEGRLPMASRPEKLADLPRRLFPEYRLIVLTLAYTGLRFGELAALRVSRLDLMRRRALIAESVTPVKGVMTWGTPKGHERREVPIPRFLVDELAQHIAGKAPTDLVFTGERGGVLRYQAFQRACLTDAAERTGVPGFHLHELRHTAASLAIASGADVKVVQQMLGHKSATMTLDLYGHLFGDRLDVVADAMDAARTSALANVYKMCTDAEVVELRPEAI